LTLDQTPGFKLRREHAEALSEIEKELRGLAPGDQERLLRALLEELDGPPDADAEAAWREEIHRRSHEIDSRVAEPVPADEVFARARADLTR
jgi:putative addiction module component (TIGR02574 family)